MYYIYIIGECIASLLPRSIGYQISKVISSICFTISKKDKDTLLYNLYPVIKDRKKAIKLSKEAVNNFAYYLVDFLRYNKFNRNFVDKYVEISGLENLDQAHAKGKGVIAITAHIGNYELAGAVIALLGYPLSVVALPHKKKKVNDFFNGNRLRVGIKVIPTGIAVKGCVSVLRKGEVLAILGDKSFSSSGRNIEMFSKSAVIPRGASFFALKTGAEIIPSFLVRRKKFFYNLIFEKPIKFDKGSACPEKEILEQYTEILGKYIKKYPGQWYMFEKYWVDASTSDNERRNN